MSELTDSFKKVDPVVYAFVDQVLPKIQNKLWNGRIYDANGKRLKDVGQWLAAIEAGTWAGVRPFFSGGQYSDWQASNCERCKAEEGADMNAPPTCPILYAIQYAYIGSGCVSADIARRMGYEEGSCEYVWECSEVEWTEGWKAEVLDRRVKATQNGGGA